MREPWAPATYEAAEQWIDHGLRDDDSLFTPGSVVWSAANLEDLLRRVVDNPDLGKALGALDYFGKPGDGKELVDRLARFKLEPGANDGGMRVLVVDAEAANRTWLTRILEPAGFHVVIASGGREAIDLAKAHPPDLVLLDLMMPEVTGFDVVEALRADPRTEDTPIIVAAL